MNWDAVGAVGEIVGAAAVALTLIYLAVQTRQNTEAVQHALTRLSELFRNGLRDPESLNANDRYRFRLLLDALVFHWEHAVRSDFSLPKANITRTLSQPGGVWY